MGADHSETNWRLAKAARAVPENVTMLRRKVLCPGGNGGSKQGEGSDPRYLEDCGKRRQPASGRYATRRQERVIAKSTKAIV